MALSKTFHPFAVIHDLKRTIASIRDQWRSTRRENERLRKENEQWLRVQNRDVDWAQHQIVIRGANAKDAENRRLPFDPHCRLAPILKRRAALGPSAFVFGSPDGEFQDSFKTAWESLLLVANGHETKRAKPGVRVDRLKLRQIDLHWHDMRHHAEPRIMPRRFVVSTTLAEFLEKTRLRRSA